MNEFDKGKMVIYYVLVSLCLFSILVYIFVVIYLFSCFRVILEGNGRKERKLGENEQNWMKLQIAEKFKSRELTLWVTKNNFPNLAKNRLGNRQISFLAFLAIRVTSKLILRGPKNSEKKERIEERGVPAIQASIFLHFSAIFC